MTKKQIVFLLVLLLIWVAGFEAFNYKINNFEKISATKTDAIVVLTGGRNRLKEAVKLLNANRAEKMFISGVFKDTSLRELQNREDVEIFNSDKVTLDKKSTNTVENAKETSEWIKKNKINSIYLVTSNYHMPRSMAEFRRYNPKLEIVPYPVYSEKISHKWWKNWHSFSLLASEYNKFLYVLIVKSVIVKKGE